MSAEGASARSRLAHAGIALACALLVAGAALLLLVRTARGRAVLLTGVTRLSGYEVRAGTIEVSPGLVVRARDLWIASPGMPAFFHAGEANVDFSLGSLVRGRAQLIEAHGFELWWRRLPQGGGGGGRARFDELRLLDGVVHDLAGATTTEIVIPHVIFAHRRSGGDFDVRGKLLAPARNAEIFWAGHADPAGKRLAVRGQGRVDDFDGLLRDLALVEGPTVYAGPLELALRARGSLDGNVRSRVRARMQSPHLKQDARARARVAADETWNNLRLKLALHTAGVAPLLVHGHVRRGESPWGLDLRLTWTDLGLRALAKSLSDPPPWLPSEGKVSGVASVTGTLRTPLAEARVDATQLKVRAGSVNLRTDAHTALRLEEGVLRSLDPGLTLEKFTLSSGATTATAERITSSARVTSEADRMKVDLTDVALSGGGLRNDDRALQSAGLAFGGTIGVGIAHDGTMSGEIELETAGGEVLYDRAYVSLADFPVELTTSVSHTDKALRLESFSLVVSKMGRVEGRATFDEKLSLHDVDAQADLPSLGTPFEHLVRETFQEEWPLLAGTEAGGALVAKVEYGRGDGAWHASGRVTVKNGSLVIKDPAVRMERYDVDVPFDVATGPGNPKPANGFVRTGDIEIGGLRVAAVELPLVARTNELSVAQPIEIPFAGGGVRIVGLRAYDLSSAPAADASLTVERMHLDELTAAAGLPRIDGTIAGDLGRVALTSEHIVIDGALGVSVSGGHVAITNLGVDDVFSRVPALHLDAEATGIDLRQATENLGVGYVSGMGRAKVEGLEISAGQPVRFDAEFETVPTRGVPQRISVTAIQQLTVLGGADANALTGSILGLFYEYRYAKMGFRCSLRNDRFILHGIAEHDDKDFLVVGTLLPPTVNVISHNQVIAFKQMVERLRRISAIPEGKVRVE